jgi:hypothetical protein
MQQTTCNRRQQRLRAARLGACTSSTHAQRTFAPPVSARAQTTGAVHRSHGMPCHALADCHVRAGYSPGPASTTGHRPSAPAAGCAATHPPGKPAPARLPARPRWPQLTCTCARALRACGALHRRVGLVRRRLVQRRQAEAVGLQIGARELRERANAAARFRSIGTQQAQSRRRCGSGEPSPGADVPAQMWQG